MKIQLLGVLVVLACSLTYATNKPDSSKTITINSKTTNAYMPVLTVTSVFVEESNGSASVPIQLDVIDTVDTTITITTVDNTATSPDDYTTTIVNATIPAGQLGISVTIPITDDFIGEPSENFFVNATITSGNTANTTASGTVTIGPNNFPSLNIQSISIQESAGVANITIALSNPSSQNTVFDIATQNNTAVAPVDYTPVNETGIVIASGMTNFMYSIPIIDDSTVETVEDFDVIVTVTSGNTSNNWDSGTVTIIDNDDSVMSVGDVTVSENAGTALVPVIISGPNPVETTVQITTTDNTAITPDDYTPTTVTATIPPFQTSVDVVIPIIDDNLSEPTEDFTVNGVVTSGNILNTTDSGTVTITDDDQITLIINDISVSEDAGSITVPITIDGLTIFDTGINITTTDNTAVAPNDYTTVMTSVTIPGLQSSVNVTIPIIDDDVFEVIETFTIQGTVTTGNTINVNAFATITITDDGSCGSGVVGDPCDDGNSATLFDFIDENCNCIGEAVADVDGDGIPNGEEVLNGTDYNNPCDPIQNIGYTGYDADNSVWQNANCDNDDINNALEVILGSDPYDTNFNTIQGSIVYDVNGDGCNGMDDTVFSFTRLDINDGSNTTSIYTNDAGLYTYITTTGNYTVTPNLENPTFFNVTPANATANFSTTNNSVFNQDFCVTNSGTNPDVEITISPIEFARPGFDAVYLITYNNNGNQIVSGDITFTYDDTVTSFVSSTQTPDSQSSGVLQWNYTNLTPFENRDFYITLNVNSPMATPPVNINDELTYTATINPVAGDVSPEDNMFELEQTVVGSYDPNDITCLEGNVVDADKIGEYLHYIINFENTGTFFAENIVVEMDIDPTEFDINTLRLLGSSHDANVTINGTMVRFIFQSIFLPVDGQGNILIKIKSQNTLAPNDTVSNDARIFFDYNFPIQTNIASTTYAVLNNPTFDVETSMNIYPNPTKNTIHIEATHTIQNIEIYDVQGRLLAKESYTTQNVTLNLSNQAKGIYFVKIKTAKGVKTQKVVKM
ncbi:calx-beta domain protein [Kordia sp. SMS9]|uniref:Calx-beta domain-containing protein n=1 Tax=Kordia sp. SMS9 TaxID=2282170 RepID=UPI000E0E047B|nr:Calx-beta domain-containing protein [Kordia sp. SMS9]AXG71161.1 calx-beta domain protein [Kordia sp. SMS9]